MNLFLRPKQGLIVQSGLTRFRLAPNSYDLDLIVFSDHFESILATLTNTSPRPEYVYLDTGAHKLIVILRKGNKELAREMIEVTIPEGKRVHLRFRPRQGRVISARNPEFYAELS